MLCLCSQYSRTLQIRNEASASRVPRTIEGYSPQSPSPGCPVLRGRSPGSPTARGQNDPFERSGIPATAPSRPYSPYATAPGGPARLGLALPRNLILSLFLVGNLLVLLDRFLHYSLPA